jgi:hypothetical protein
VLAGVRDFLSPFGHRPFAIFFVGITVWARPGR